MGETSTPPLSSSGARAEIKSLVSDYRWTVSIVLFVSTVYALQLSLAGSLSSAAAETGAMRFPQELAYALAPWIHGDHAHFGLNLVGLLACGVYIETWLTDRVLYVFTPVAAYVSVYAPEILLGTGVVHGMSGVVFGLAVYIVLNRVASTLYCVRNHDGDRKAAFLREIVAERTVGLTLVVAPMATVARLSGIMSTPEDVSVAAHVVGAVLGAVSFVLVFAIWWQRNGSEQV